LLRSQNKADIHSTYIKFKVYYDAVLKDRKLKNILQALISIENIR